VLSKESLVLAFEERATAEEWWQQLEAAIEALRRTASEHSAGSKQVRGGGSRDGFIRSRVVACG